MMETLERQMGVDEAMTVAGALIGALIGGAAMDVTGNICRCLTRVTRHRRLDFQPSI